MEQNVKKKRIFQPIVTIQIVVVMVHASLENVTAKPVGRARDATRLIREFTSVCQAVPIMARTIWRPHRVSARNIGPVSIVHNRAVTLNADLMDPANKDVASQ